MATVFLTSGPIVKGQHYQFLWAKRRQAQTYNYVARSGEWLEVLRCQNELKRRLQSWIGTTVSISPGYPRYSKMADVDLFSVHFRAESDTVMSDGHEMPLDIQTIGSAGNEVIKAFGRGLLGHFELIPAIAYDEGIFKGQVLQLPGAFVSQTSTIPDTKDTPETYDFNPLRYIAEATKDISTVATYVASGVLIYYGVKYTIGRDL